MTENEPGRDHNNDDFDLMVLLERIFSFSRRYGSLVVSCTLAGMLLGFLTLAFCLTIISVSTARIRQAPTTQVSSSAWSYRQIWFWERDGYYRIDENLAKVGNEGWELVSFTQVDAHYVDRGIASKSSEHCLVATFKKPVALANPK